MPSIDRIHPLTRNTATRAFWRVPKRLPRKIEYYSRFTSQLNILRTEQNANTNISKLIFKNPPKLFSVGVKNIDLFDFEKKNYHDKKSLKTLVEENKDKSYLNQDDNIKNMTKDNDRTLSLDQYGDSFANDLFNKRLFYTDVRDETESNENNYIYNHIHRRLNKFALLTKDVTTLPVYPQIQTLKKKLATKLDHEDNELEQYKKSIDEIVACIGSFIKYMNQQELAILLTYIKSETSPKFKIIMRMIDIELKWLLKKNIKTTLMDIDLYFYCSDIFYECLFRSTFVYVFVRYLVHEKDIHISNTQFLHLLFLVILQRKQNGVLSEYQSKIMNVLKNCSFEDLATICMAYFKTKTPITDRALLNRIINKTIDFLPDIKPHEPGFCGIVKSIRYSCAIAGARENVSSLIMKLSSDDNINIIKTSPYNLVQTCKLMEAYRIYDERLLKLLHGKLFSKIDNFRIKDVQYALTTLSNFSYNNLTIDGKMKEGLEKLCKAITGHERGDSKAQFAHLLPLLRALAMFGFYDQELTSYAYDSLLDNDRLSIMKNKLEFTRSALLIYTTSCIEGVHLNEEMKFFCRDSARYLPFLRSLSDSFERYGNFGTVKRDTSLDHLKFILQSKQLNYHSNTNLYRNLSLALSSDENLKDPCYKFTFQNTMSHQNYADLVITKNCEAPGDFDRENLEPKRVPENQKHCIILSTTSFDYLDGFHRLSGYKRLIRRILERLGYDVLLVNINDPPIPELALEIRRRID